MESTQLTLCAASQTCRVQQTCCSSLGVCWQGRGDRSDFRGRVSASGPRMPWQLSCRPDLRSLGSCPPPPCQQCLQVMFGPWMLPARGPRRSEQSNPAGEKGVCCQGQYAAAQVPLWWVVRHSLGLQGWEGGDDRPGKGGPPLVRVRTWKGAGVVVGASLVDLQVEKGGRVGTLTRTSLDSDP